MTDAQPIKILFLTASPDTLGRVNAGREAREIREKLRTTAHRDAIDLIERSAVRAGDLQQLLFEVRPEIVHFSGHGTTEEELVFEDDRGGAVPLGKAALTDLFRVHKDHVRVVVLSACHSRPQIEAISEHIECAIGMRRAIGSEAAAELSAAFYRAIGFGSSVRKAFDSAVAELRAKGIPEDRTPQLVLRPGTDADAVLLVRPGGAPRPTPALADPPAPPAPKAPVTPVTPAPTVPVTPVPTAPVTPVSKVASAGALAASADLPTGENRVCTVISVDLSDFLARSPDLDPSEMKDLLDRCQRAVTEAIGAFGGVVDRRGGGEALGVFGALRATESAAERAIRAALAIHGALAGIRLPRRARIGVETAADARLVRGRSVGTSSASGGRARSGLSARIGVATGRLFAERTESGFTVIGEAVISADRLGQAAAPGTIVVDRDTSRAIPEHFQIEALPRSQTAPGAAPAFRVKGPAPAHHGLPRQDFFGQTTALVGRAAERQRLLDALDATTREQRAAVVTLVGPLGAGRTRLLAELVSAVAASTPAVFLCVAQSSALHENNSYGLVADLVRAHFQISEGASREEILRLLRRGARLWGRRALESLSARIDPLLVDVPAWRDIDDALQQIAILLDTSRSSSAPGVTLSPDSDGAAAKHRLAAAAACLVRFAASIAPLVIVCDDVQWTDDASLDLLDDLVFRAEDLPVLVVCAARPDLYERRPHWGEGRAAHRRVDLAPLDRRHIEEMIRDRLRRAPDLSPDFVRAVAERAEGSPFILDETLRLLVDVGVIEIAKDEGPLHVHERDLGALALPATVQGLVQARLDRLEPRERALLARAAVVGKTFWEGVVDDLCRDGDLLAGDQETAELLADLREKQIVRERETTTFPGERERVFAESATQEVAYEALPARARRELHLHVAAWLEARAPGGAHAALLALHHDRGGDARAAIDAYETAARRASSLGQNAEALRCLSRACALLQELEEPSLSEDAPDVSWQDRARVWMDLGDVLRRLGRLDAAEAAYDEACAHVPAGDPEGLRWRARADFRVALSLKVRGATTAARELAERAVARAKEAGIVDETPAMHALLAFLYRREGQHEASWRSSLTGLRVCRSLPRDDEPSLERRTRALLGVAPALYSRKRWIAAERTYRQAARIAAASGDVDLLGRAQNGVAASLLARGKIAEARAMFKEALRVKQKAGDLHQIAVAYVNLSELANTMGDHAVALDHARRSIRLAEQAQARSDLPEMYRNLAVASIGLGDIGPAIEASLHAIHLAESVAPVYLPGAVETLVAAAETAVARAEIRERTPSAALAREALSAVKDRSFVDAALRARIEAILGSQVA